jgi:hypothetical protein
MFSSYTGEKADHRFEQILQTIKTKDKDSLKVMFSKKALEEASQIDETIEHLFTFIQGDIVSWTRNGGLNVSSEFDHGNKIEETKFVVYFATNEQKYLAYIIECTKDTAQPENIGLYTLRIIKEEDRGTSWQDLKIAGVYVKD